jgi:UDP-glucose 4-epimerase
MSDQTNTSLKGKTILVTGARGYIGSALVEKLSHVAGRLIFVDRSDDIEWRPSGTQASIELLHWSAIQANQMVTLLSETDYIFHLASVEYYYGDEEKVEYSLQANVLPLLSILEHCSVVKKFPPLVFTSSANLFGLTDDDIVTESTPTAPESAWGFHKYIQEQYLRYYGRKFGLSSVTLRLPNIYGPAPRPDVGQRVVVNRVVQDVLSGAPLTTYGNRECLRDFVHIDDVVRALSVAVVSRTSEKAPVYLLGTGETYCLRDVWATIATIVDQQTGCATDIVENNSIELNPLEYRSYAIDASRFTSDTGWTPSYLLHDGLADLVSHLVPE